MALVQIRVRRDPAATWTLNNPVLLLGEIGAETDTGKIKVGDGVSTWTQRPYSGAMDLSSSIPPDVGTGSAGTSSLCARADHTHSIPSAISVQSVTASGNVVIGGTLTLTGSLVGGAHTQASTTITDWAEAVQDTVGAMVVAGNGVAVSYSDAAGTLTISVSGTLDGGTYVGTNV